MYNRRVPQKRPSVSIFQSELVNIAGLAASAKHTEIGGSLFGLFGSDQIVIMLAIPPGPNAKMGRTFFHDDHRYIEMVSNLLWNTFSIEFVGSQHSHKINLDRPSLRDIQATHSIASRNGFKRLCQLIISFTSSKETAHAIVSENDHCFQENSNFCTDLVQTPERLFNPHHTPNHQIQAVRINAFVYLDPEQGQPIRCGLRVIPGESPIRKALRQTSVKPRLSAQYAFPLPHIKYDILKYDRGTICANHNISRRISDQLLKLPKYVVDGAKVKFEKSYSILRLPILEKSTLFIVYRTHPKDEVTAVYLSNNETTQTTLDVTKIAIHGPYTKISTIYNRMLREAPNNNFGGRST